MTIFIVYVLYFLAEDLLKDLIFGKKLSESNGEYIDKWGRGILHTISLCVFFFFIMKIQDYDTVKVTWLSIITIALVFQAFMEWKYLEGSKEYIMTSIILPISLFIVILF
ncbi:DUF4181 domain-containing protein [Lederbergia wuyishanensis]|uniref:DUF4181 domain-containing protein n=1 Tax=Lederbergia wuyishanensis TaxID=1347903 RepID=UPI001FD50C4D|nr:DUF4181 domain-containing protein [Lederbergia wuyishanensis]MCJ8009576.1 DUF4181 domain-containing protein [Lederbergia wuyishanensis]